MRGDFGGYGNATARKGENHYIVAIPVCEPASELGTRVPPVPKRTISARVEHH
jgi:hypothetical protein